MAIVPPWMDQSDQGFRIPSEPLPPELAVPAGPASPLGQLALPEPGLNGPPWGPGDVRAQDAAVEQLAAGAPGGPPWLGDAAVIPPGQAAGGAAGGAVGQGVGEAAAGAPSWEAHSRAPGSESIRMRQRSGAPPSYEQEVRGLAGAEGEVTGNLAEMEAQRAEMTQKRNEILAERKQLQNEELQRDELKRRADLERRQAEIDAQRQAVGQMKINPEQWFHEGGDRRKIGLIVGGFLSGFVGDDSFHKAVDGMVKRNIDAQHDNIENGWKAVTVADDIYRRMYDQYKDQGKTDAAFAAMNLDALAGMMDAQIMKVDSPEIRQKGMLARIGIQQKATQLVRDAAVKDQELAIQRTQAHQQGADRALAWEQFHWQQRKDIVTAAAADYAAAQKEADAARQEAQDQERSTVNDPSGAPVKNGEGKPVVMYGSDGKPDPKLAAEENDRLAGRTYALMLMEDYGAWLNANMGSKVGGRYFGGGLGFKPNEEYSVGDSLHWRIVTAQSHAEGQGAFDKGIQDVIGGKVIPGPSTYLSPTNAEKVVPNLVQQGRTQMNEYMRQKHRYKGNYWDDYLKKHPVELKARDTNATGKRMSELPGQGGVVSPDTVKVGPQGAPAPLGQRPPGPYSDQEQPSFDDSGLGTPDWVRDSRPRKGKR